MEIKADEVLPLARGRKKHGHQHGGLERKAGVLARRTVAVLVATAEGHLLEQR